MSKSTQGFMQGAKLKLAWMRAHGLVMPPFGLVLVVLCVIFLAV
jgi:hypothetical protein